MDYNLAHVQFSRRLNLWCAESDHLLGGPEHRFLWSLYEAWERAMTDQATMWDDRHYFDRGMERAFVWRVE